MSAAPGAVTVYEGAVTHRRFKPVGHRLKYRVFSFLLDLDALDDAARSLRFFSRGRFNLFSFYDRDHGRGRPADIARYIRGALGEAGIEADGRILLLCYPRMLGYVFNPLSVYYCHDAEGRLTAMVYEVRNTFGDDHTYIIPVEADPETIDQTAEKAFHVSPFIDMDMRYHFQMSRPGDAVSMSIQTLDAEGPLLNANFSGEGAAVTDAKLLSLFFRYPLMTMKVIVGIHLEALKLVMKGMRLRGGEVPEHATTVVRPEAKRASAA